MNRIEINDDQFFQSKGANSRIQKRDEVFLSKIKSGLENIREDYKNKKWKTNEERLFLKTLSKFRINKTYEERWDGYFLEDEDNKISCILDLKNETFCVSYDHVWIIFAGKLHWDYIKSKSFMKLMLNEHFKLCKFTYWSIRMLNDAKVE